jgi:hypothetical protein
MVQQYSKRYRLKKLFALGRLLRPDVVHFHFTCLGTSGVASPTIWSCYANFKSLSLLISLEIDCFHGLLT